MLQARVLITGGALIAALGAGACGGKTPAPSAAVPPRPTPAQRLTSADALLREGCLDCLIDAFHEYDQLRQFPAVADVASAGAVRAAALVARRQRELGMVDDGYAQRAKAVIASGAAVPGWMGPTLDIIEVLPAGGGGMTRTPTGELDLQRQRVLRVNQETWAALLRERAPTDELAAYVWLSLACGATEFRDLTLDQLFEPAAPYASTPLITLKRATCRAINTESLGRLAVANPRFVETEYWLGLYAVGQRKLNDADRQFDAAYGWRQQWPSLTQSIANVAMTAEEFARALTFYDRTLEAEPKAVDALLGRVRALTYLARNDEAIAAASQLIGLGWYVGDARYWRAYNETDLERYEDAWTDIEAANKLLINAEVPKLAGLIAYRRQQLDVSRGKFDTAHTRNPNDCETFFYLGVVNAELKAWQPTAEILTNAAKCLQATEQVYLEEIKSIESSDDPPERKAAKIERRHQWIAKARRQLATSWFDVAVASYNLSRKADAQQYAEKVVDDEQFGARAKEILSRVR
jgi:tetratricopeptide (TPR) repeat protein